MIRHGAKPTLLDKRDYSYHRTFPHFAAAAPKDLELLTYSYDTSGIIPDQNADGLPYGCTGYTQAHIKGNQDKRRYLPSYTYLKTCLMEGHAADQGCDIRISAKSLRVYGALASDDVQDVDGIPQETQDSLAAKNKSGQSFNVDRAPRRDWFDSFRIALRAQKQGISIGTPWFSAFSEVSGLGILPMPYPFEFRDAKSDPNTVNWHDYAFYGETIIGGAPHIVALTWQGKGVGDNGIIYFNREVFNATFDMWGTIGLVTAVAKPEDIMTIKLDMFQTILTFLNRMLSLIGRSVPVHA